VTLRLGHFVYTITSLRFFALSFVGFRATAACAASHPGQKRMPATMHSFYLRNMYHENRLAIPGGISLAGVAIDLARILSTREDHIAPWQSTYAATQLYKGPIKFVLADSGHIVECFQALRSTSHNFSDA